MLVAPVIPKVFKEKGLSYHEIGIVFAAYSLPMMFISPIIGKMLPVIGRKKVCILGCIFLASANFIFALFNKVNDPMMLLIFAIINRLI